MNWLFTQRLRSFVLLAAAASLLLNLALLVPALYMMQVFDRVFASRSVETLAMLSVLVLLALGLGYFVDTVRTRALAFAGRALDRQLSPVALATALRQAASVAGRVDMDTLRDITQLRAFLGGNGVLALFDAPWLPLYLLVIGLMHPALGVAAAIGALALLLLGVLTERLTRANTEQVVRRSRAVTHHADALTRNAEAIVGMGMSPAAIAGWQKRQDALLETQAAVSDSSSSLGGFARMLRQLVQVAMLALGAWLVIETQASAGIMIAATILLGRALQPVEHLISGWRTLIEARGAWRRLSERPASGMKTSSVALPAPHGRIDVEGITFTLAPGKPPLIKGVGFALERGESLGIVGPSASGKTTLIRLLLGLWTPHAGVVRIDGADIARWDRDALGQHVGYLPQSVELLSGTVAENIARLGPVDSERVVAAARLAHAHEMILRLPYGYDTEIGEGGAVLSGGQRQRIALARALYGNPRFVVLDEPNANLDMEGEIALAAALRELKARATTVIMVSHRPALMAQLDKLALLRNGTLEAFGPAVSILRRLRANTKAERPANAAGDAVTTDISEALV